MVTEIMAVLSVAPWLVDREVLVCSHGDPIHRGTLTVRATYEPDPAAGEVYAALLKEFVNLYEKTKAIHKRLNGRRFIG